MRKYNFGISVIVCCFNSAKRLPKTLQCLALQQVPSNFTWEIIIVNNASTDNTVQVAQAEWAKHGAKVQFRIIEEENPGLSSARNKGIESAQNKFCLFCDDDNWLHENYLKLAFETMQIDSLIGAVGGQGEPVFEGGRPMWFTENVWGYAIGPQLIESGYIDKQRGYLYGAGLIINKEIWSKCILPFASNLCNDRKGGELTSGGDTEMCYILLINGYKLYYNEKLKFKHFVGRERLTISYYKKLCQGFGKAGAILSPYRYFLNGNTKLTSPIWIMDIIYKAKNLLFVIQEEKIVRITAFYEFVGYVKETFKMKSKYDKRINDLSDIKKQIKNLQAS